MKTTEELRILGRSLVRHLGVLNRNILPLSQCHILVELEQHKSLSSKQLCELLLIDKAALSRVVLQLCESGYVRFKDDPDDLRRKPLVLTTLGLKKVKDIHASANARINVALTYLNAKQKQRVVEGLSLYVEALKRTRLAEEE